MISWTDHVRNEEEIEKVKEERNILHTIKRRKANWICHILDRNCLLKRVIEVQIKGRIEVMRRQVRRRNLPPDDLQEKRRYWKLIDKHHVALCGELGLEEAMDLP
jgi:hypothetical protein